MKINLASDLHLEFSTDLVLPGGDVLILAGDLCEAKNLKQPKIQDWVFENLTKYRDVLYVLGNHESYGMRIDRTKELVEEYMPENVRVMENQTHVIDDVMFVGGTLWTDMNRGDGRTMMRCKFDMSDYKHITMFNRAAGAYHKLTPEHTTVLHRATRDYIVAEADANPDKKLVVITHMLPSNQAISEEYKDDYTLNGAFASDLDDIIISHPNIKTWCFGHTHDFKDFVVGETRLLCNPRGYYGFEQRVKEFDPSFGFDI
jgi:predicted phosphodiesterase